jgi:hypothetical protein
LERALHELWAALKVAPCDHDPQTGGLWDVYYRWAPREIEEGVRLSDMESLSALISKYLDAVVAATQEDIENLFSAITTRGRVAEVIRTLLAARQFVYTPSESRTLITVAHPVASESLPTAPGRVASVPRRRRNG